jgi:hypothetical protein
LEVTHPEIAEELFASDLRPDDVVVLRAIHRPGFAFSVRVMDFTKEAVRFFAGGLDLVFEARIVDGRFYDNLNHRIFAYKYLGD